MPRSGSDKGTGAEAGFTLVELLVVIFIIGLMVSVISLRPGVGPSADERHAEDVAKALRLLSRESILSGQPTAFALSGSDYVLQRWDGDNWQSFEFDRQRLPASVPGDVQFSLGNERTDPGNEAEAGDTDLNQLVVFLPVGEATPVLLGFSSPKGSSEVRVTPGGEITVSEGDRP